MGNTAAVVAQSYDMKGKVVVVTGANSGIGKETARGLARYGAHVILACRSMEKGKEVVDEIKSEIPDSTLDLLQLDLLDWDSIKNFVSELKSKFPYIHGLINNAGFIQDKYQKSKHNYEAVLTVNYLGTVLLTEYCLELLEKAPEENGRPRIVMVASNSHSFVGELNLKDLELDPSKIDTEIGFSEMMNNYGRTKLCLLLYTLHLNKKLRSRKSRILLYPVDPGYVGSNLGFSGSEDKFYIGIARKVHTMIAKTNTEGAVPSLYCACDPLLEDELKSGLYFEGVDKLANLAEAAKNESVAKMLWKWTRAALTNYL
jgi:NAD(P)-dependent dehydrogenase (short-subunit alcohol dehydrogenase family)